MNCTVCCVSDAAVTYARDSFCGFSGGPFVLSMGGGGPDILAPGLHIDVVLGVNSL